MLERLFTFSKAQVSSFVGGIVDYLVMVLFTECFHVHYTLSIVIGGIVGAIVNFSINKFWTFKSKEHPYELPLKKQLSRFVLVVLNSIALKVSGTYLITTFIGIDYKISRIITDLIVSWAVNYTLQRSWVFKKKKLSKEVVRDNE
ncbi:MAG: GtrA family protein [Bacteroidota bacterium]|nr:GtrA family protein [Bacteroidota bacterium]